MSAPSRPSGSKLDRCSSFCGKWRASATCRVIVLVDGQGLATANHSQRNLSTWRSEAVAAPPDKDIRARSHPYPQAKNDACEKRFQLDRFCEWATRCRRSRCFGCSKSGVLRELRNDRMSDRKQKRPIREDRPDLGLSWCGVTATHLLPRGFDSLQLHRYSGRFYSGPPRIFSQAHSAELSRILP